MTSYTDLEPLGHFGTAAASLRAVGWLERGDRFPTGEIEPRVFARLKELLIDPFSMAAAGGFHDCSVCLYAPEARGSRNLFVPGDGFLYVCPELICIT